FLGLTGRDAVEGLRIELDLPARRAGAGQLDLLCGRGAAVLQNDRDRRFLSGRGTRAQQTLAARQIELGLARDVEAEIGRNGRVFGRDLAGHGVLAGAHRVRRLDLELDVLGLAG